MSALPTQPAALEFPHDLKEARLEPMRADALAQVMQIERSAYDLPWTELNIADSIRSGYHCVQLVGGTDTVLGYFIAMQGADEVHLLNITVDPTLQRQGWGRVLLDALALWARGQQAQWLWLEVRVGNLQAITVYERFGFRRVGKRKDYYPALHNSREDAIVMSYKL
jgi:[ribosomal protein S18]-alanine N-acetyltransferase